MEKKPFYVTVQQGRVLDDPTATPYEFDIMATQEEAGELQKLFERMPAQDFTNYVDAHIPYVPYHQRETNDVIDENLRQIYKKIYELGTEETKRFMDEHKIHEIERIDHM